MLESVYSHFLKRERVFGLPKKRYFSRQHHILYKPACNLGACVLWKGFMSNSSIFFSLPWDDPWGYLRGVCCGNPVWIWPVKDMAQLAKDLKIWAAVAAIGGSFDSLQTLETGLLEGQIRLVVKQLAFMVAAFAGAHLGYVLVMSLSHTNK